MRNRLPGWPEVSIIHTMPPPLACSILLIEFPIFSSDAIAALQPWCVSLLGHHFLTKLCVLDLDPKPDSHFHKFMAQTREIEKCRRALN